MVVIRAHFDGEKVIMPPDAQGARPGEVLLLFPPPQTPSAERQDWAAATEENFARVWDNEADEIYDHL